MSDQLSFKSLVKITPINQLIFFPPHKQGGDVHVETNQNPP